VIQRHARKERAREILDEKREDEEIEGVERPAEESGEDGIPLVGGAVRCQWLMLNAEC